MNYKQIEQIELKTGCRAIEFDGADGLYVFFNPQIKHGLTIAGTSGNAFFDKDMAKQLPSMLKNYENVRRFELKGKHGSTILRGDQARELANSLTEIVETYLEEAN